MAWGFEVGRSYNRRRDIHEKFGGQQQGGIITPAQHPVVFLITGEEGHEHGYADRYRDDGVFEYFGEGQVGDMRLRAGNKAIAEHSENGRSLLLFSKSKSGLSFEGEMVCEGYRVERAPDRIGAERDAFVFLLRPLEAIVEHTETDASGSKLNLAQLRELALSASKLIVDSKTQNRNVYERSRDVKIYVLARAAGNCEGCLTPAPFKRANGDPYLEPHHTRRVSDGGPDHPSHVIALCPNCHRRVHAGMDGKTYNARLIQKATALEGG